MIRNAASFIKPPDPSAPTRKASAQGLRIAGDFNFGPLKRMGFPSGQRIEVLKKKLIITVILSPRGSESAVEAKDLVKERSEPEVTSIS